MLLKHFIMSYRSFWKINETLLVLCFSYYLIEWNGRNFTHDNCIQKEEVFHFCHLADALGFCETILSKKVLPIRPLQIITQLCHVE